MKKLFVILMLLIFICCGCNRSQFSTTTRQSSNGRVTYVNHYYPERIKSTKKIFASTSKRQTSIGLNESHFVFIKNEYPPDTIKRIAPQKGSTIDFSALQVIKFKSGKTKTVNSVYQSSDTLYYQLTSSPEKIRFEKVEQVDTVFQVRYFDPEKGEVVDIRKNERLGNVGFIFSFLGLVPIFGLPFAILAVIFGIVSMRRVSHQPDKYRGRGKASLILGIIGITVSALILIILAISGAPDVSI